MKALIVEDDLVSFKIIESIIMKYGEPDFAADGEAAVDMFRSALDSGAPYDLICLDVKMPRLDGISALKEIRKYEGDKGVSSESSVKVLMTTGHDVESEAQDAGCTAYLKKPVDRGQTIKELQGLGFEELPEE